MWWKHNWVQWYTTNHPTCFSPRISCISLISVVCLHYYNQDPHFRDKTWSFPASDNTHAFPVIPRSCLQITVMTLRSTPKVKWVASLIPIKRCQKKTQQSASACAVGFQNDKLTILSANNHSKMHRKKQRSLAFVRVGSVYEICIWCECKV